jgi:hypothetical protein
MSKRVTIMIPDELDQKVRNFQSLVISKTHNTYSFSSAICESIQVPTRVTKKLLKRFE